VPAGATPDAARHPEVAPGDTVGRYTIERAIGAGRMGRVYEAVSAEGRHVALKLINRALLDDEVFRRRFAREGRAPTRVAHPHVVAVIETGEHEGVPYIVQDLIRGGSLQSHMRHEGTLQIAAAVRLCQEVASGLDALHYAGVIHRDLNPGNILFDESGGAYITDFGLAKQRDATALTRPGQAIGSLHYISPEQIRGEEATAAADIYSLGCVMWECVCGTPPFADREGMRILWAHLQEDAPDPCTKRADLPASLGWALTRALEKDPERRPPTATAYGHLVSVAARSSR
jgi:serine/threonine protein kinase